MPTKQLYPDCPATRLAIRARILLGEMTTHNHTASKVFDMLAHEVDKEWNIEPGCCFEEIYDTTVIVKGEDIFNTNGEKIGFVVQGVYGSWYAARS